MDHLPRDIVPDFDSQSFYTLHNSAAPDRTLSAGYKWTNGSVTMGKYTTLSSENWQLYFQQGCYFIRNRDYPSLQLGLTQNDRTVPVLMQKNGSIGQQWGISKTSKGWYFKNGLLGNGSYLALTATNKAPAMSPSEQGSVWDIMSNPSAGNPMDLASKDSYGEVVNFETKATTMATISTPGPTTVAVHTSTLSSPTSSPPTDIHSHMEAYTASPLGAGAIAGIAIGSFAVIVAALALVLFLLRERRRFGSKPNVPHAELPDKKVVEIDTYAYRGELGITHPRMELEAKEARQAAAELP